MTAADALAWLAQGHIPLWIKIVYTLFMAVLVPVYLERYGPTNFLYFCDVALLLTLIGIWAEQALLLSASAVGILVAQTFWLVDYLANFAGWRITGMTAYMFDAQRSRFLRGLSLFHAWLPLLLLYLVAKTGYDPRALPVWTALGTALLLICYFFMPPPGPRRGIRPVNINYVYGLADDAPQRWMPPLVWLLFILVGFPIVLYWPAHLFLMRVMPPA